MYKSMILKKPIITEKTTRLMERENKYVFEVEKDSTKASIKQAIRDVFEVEVLSVKVLKSSPKTKRSWVGKRKLYEKPFYKKAIVEIKEGQVLKIYEGGAK